MNLDKIESGEIKLEVLIYQRPNLRDDGLEYERFIGRGILDSLYDKMEMRPDVTEVVLSFPENWLNVIEQRVLFNRLVHYCPNLKSIKIKTHSVYIIQCTPSQCSMIIGSEEEMNNKLLGETLEDGTINLTEKMYTEKVGSIF